MSFVIKLQIAIVGTLQFKRNKTLQVVRLLENIPSDHFPRTAVELYSLHNIPSQAHQGASWN